MKSTHNYWVAKFGGTSLANYSAMSRCANLISEYSNVRIVVVSAPAGVTNLLVKLTQGGAKLEPILNEIKSIVNGIMACHTKKHSCFCGVQYASTSTRKLDSSNFS